MSATRKKCKGGVWLLAQPDIATYIYFSPPCKLKSCTACARVMMLRHIHRIRMAHDALKHLHWYFYTITQDSEYHALPVPEDGNKPYLQHKWSMLRKRLKRRDSNMYYVRVYETHKSGVYHCHVILALTDEIDIYKKKYGNDTVLNSKFIDDVTGGLGLGYIYDIHPLVDKNISYVAKYATKSNLSKVRAIDYSRNFPRLPEQDALSPLQWHLLGNVPISKWVDYLTEQGASITLLTDIDHDEE